ncbi:class I SAM-dependent methyltransferase [Paremcibacter congregatus]|uniref:class I SAM-dependent methyltransferase n=1 Tax=Paremcibacter congregatus TaxID=2043170 RepID=UPI003A8F2906
MTSIEQDYYENEEFWAPDVFTTEDNERLAFLTSRIPENTESALDVGCGNGIFLKNLSSMRPDIKQLHGVDRSKAALRHVSTEKTEASADRLPFSDQSFDCVTCLEVIEHLPFGVYDNALDELSRVARKHILISVPLNQDLSLGQVKCPECKTLFNPDYHFRSFSKKNLQNLFKDRGFRLQEIEVYGSNSEFLFSRLITRLKKDKSNRFPMDILCLACGTTLPGQKNSTVSEDKNVSLLNNFKSFVKSIWPKVSEPRWLLAVYSRGENT